MKLKQKRGAYKTSFEFGGDELTYTFENFRAKVGSSIPYHKIPDRTNYREVRLWRLHYFTVFYLAFCATVFLSSADIDSQLVIALYFATLMFFCVCLYALTHRQGAVTAFALNPALIILQDGQRQAILEEIAGRRRQEIRKKLAQIDPHRPYYEEISKFSWLKEEGIITAQELLVWRQKIAAMRDKSPRGHTSPSEIN